MQIPLFYNTIDLPAKELREVKSVCRTQEEIILRVYKRNPQPLTAYEVYLCTEMECLNSVRRAVTNLYKKGFLIKTDIQKTGLYGKPNYCYRIK